LPAPLVGDLERDPTVEIDVLELNVRRVALRPPGIGQVLLRRVRDGARPQEEGEPARPDDGRFQHPESERPRWLHPGRVERRAPAFLVIPREEVVALACHADRDVSDPGPGVEPGAEGVVIRGHGAN
jgi:hypothetical protein